MLVEMDDDRTGWRMMGRDARLLRGLPEHRILRALARFDVSAGLEPPVESPVKVQQEHMMTGVEHHGGCGDVCRQRGADEGILRSVEQSKEMRDSGGLVDIDRGVLREDRGERQRPSVVAARTEARGWMAAQASTSLDRTAPVLSRS